MLRHLTERLPVSFGPKWLRNHIQPIAIADAVTYLVRAADRAVYKVKRSGRGGWCRAS